MRTFDSRSITALGSMRRQAHQRVVGAHVHAIDLLAGQPRLIGDGADDAAGIGAMPMADRPAAR